MKLAIPAHVKRFTLSRLDEDFGGQDGGDLADIVVEFRSGEKWAVRVNGAAPDDTFHPNLPGATAVIARKRGGKIEYLSARTGEILAMPGCRAHAG